MNKILILDHTPLGHFNEQLKWAVIAGNEPVTHNMKGNLNKHSIHGDCTMRIDDFVERRPEDDKRDERTTDQHAIIWIKKVIFLLIK